MKRMPALLLSFCVLTSAVPSGHAGLADPALEALAERRPDDAALLLRAELDAGKITAERHFLLARAEYLAKRLDAAIAVADAVREKWAKTPFARKAHFLKADCYVARKEFQRADEIYLAEAKALVSLSRKEEVAALYLRIADRAFAPKELGEKPDHARSERFYRLAIGIGLSADKLRQTRYRVAFSLFKRGQAWDAINELKLFIQELKTGSFIAEARYTLGRAQQQVSNLTEARKSFRDFLDEHADHGSAPKAAFRIIETFRLPTPISDPELERGVRAAREFLEKYPSHEKAIDAELLIAESFHHRSRFDEAAAAYQALTSRHRDPAPGLEAKRAAELREKVARAKVRLGDALLAQRKYGPAIETWRAYLREHPADRDSDRAQRAVLDAELEIANEHFLAKRYDAAREAWQAFLNRYPLDGRNARVMRLLGQLEYDQSRFGEAVAAWRALVSKHSGAHDSSRGHFQLAVTLADKLGDFESSMKELEKVQGSFYSQARERLNTMKEEALQVVTERTFRSGEPALVKLTQRNLNKVSVRLYKLDMETYFRRMHRLSGVEDLDLALIAPDKTWDEEVVGFAKWKESQQSVRLPITEPGVYAVAISGGKLEATTVVHVTDLALITKASRRDLLVFALDRKTGKAFAGAQILVSSGSKIVLEGTTGANGVWHKRDPELEKLSSLTVFAHVDGHVAGTASGYIGGAVQTMTPRGVVFTDRPGYKPGERVNLRAIVRRVERGAYTFNSGELYTLTITSNQGGVILSKELSLDEFGTTATTFDLDANAPTGQYYLSLVQKVEKEPATFSGSFQVQSYRLEKVRLDVLFDRPVFMRGEKITGKLSAAYQFGEPVAGKKITYQLQQEGVQKEAILDARGEATFSFESRNFDWDQVLLVTAQLVDEGVSSRGNVRLATEEFVAKAKVERPVYLVGDEALVTVEARDVLDKPRAAKFVIDVFVRPSATLAATQKSVDAFTQENLAEIVRPAGGEVKVQSVEVAVGEDGRGVARVRLEKSGEYVFRARAVDRFGNPIVAEATTTVSGADDAVKLRLFGVADEYKVGDNAVIRIHSRLAKSELALVTFEADGVVYYRIVRLAPGENPFAFKVTGAHAPNVRVAIALLDGTELQQASVDLSVKRGLQIEILPGAKVLRPGEKVKVRVRATDHNGRPVRASLSLAVVDEALFQLFADLVPGLGTHFYGQRRDMSFATAATGAYRHEAKTKSISTELLAEDARRVTEARKEAMAADEASAPKPMAIFGSPAASAAPAPPPPAEAEMGVGMGGAGAAMGRMSKGARMRSKKSYSRNGPGGYAGKADRKEGPRIRERFSELAHWSPAIVTGADGTGEVEVTLPHNTTKWRLTSRGVTVKTLVGEQRGEVITKRDFFVEARFPASLTEGDVVKPLVRVHNFTGAAGKAEVKTTVTLGETATERSATVDVPASGAGEAGLDAITAGDFKFGDRNVATILSRATSGAQSDVEKVTVPLLPWGTERRVGASGATTSSVIRTLTLGEGTFAQRSLRIDLGPSPNRLLVEMALSRRGLWTASPASAAHWVLVTEHVLQYLRSIRRGGADAERLGAQLTSLTQSLTMAQNADGGFSWLGRQRSNAYVSADALRALLLARDLGVAVQAEVISRAVAFVAGKFRALAESNHVAKAALLHALAHVRDTAVLSGHSVDAFASANRLYRLRLGLSLEALAYVTLALDRLGRQAEVQELAALIASKVGNSFDAVARPVFDKGYFTTRPWFRDRVTHVALLVDAIQRGTPTAPAVKRGIDWLLARRYGLCWFSPRLTQAAVQALSRFYASTRFTTDRYQVAVRVNGQPVTTLDVVGDGALRRIDVPQSVLQPGSEQKLEIELQGRGEVTYSALYTGFTKGVETIDEDRYLKVGREIQPAPRRLEGKELPRGFGSISGPVKTWKNALTQLPVGERAQISIELRADSNGRQGYLVVEEPIPAGTRVDPDSVRGDFLHHEVRADRIVFFVESRSWHSSLSYDLFGVIPGSYRVLPTKVTGAYDPAFLSTGRGSTLEVLPKGELSKDAYRPTPDEDLAHGRALFEKDQFEAAQVPLERILASHGSEYTLREDSYRDAVRMMLYISLAQKQSDKVVRFFEIVKEKYPELVITLEKSVEIASAYMAMREWERGLQVLRATLEASFNVESQVGGALESAGEPLESARFVRELVSNYPDLPVVQSALYGLGQHIADLDKRVLTDANLRRFKVEKGALLGDAIKLFWEFRGNYPENPTVDEAGFALANAYLGREQFKDVVTLTERLRALHPQSTFLDGYEYIQGLAAFAQERYDAALQMCRRVASGKYFNDQKTLVESSNRDLAVFIMGQIFHAQGHATRALERYKKVEDKFGDAREAIQNFERLSLAIPEVTTVRPGEKAAIDVRFRNVTEVELVVYKVDLMKLYLIHRDLNNITKVNLAGIKPRVEKSVTLAEARGYRDLEKKLTLPISEKGAYLVVLKSKEIEASGMLLVTDLELEVKEDGPSGRVRVHVLDRKKHKPVRKVFVRVVGSADGRFQGDPTDLRGVFVAEGVRGRPTVIAAKGSSYAFYRGTTVAGTNLDGNRPDYQQQPAASPAAPKAGGALQFELEKRNMHINQRAKQKYEQQLRNESTGVEVNQMK